MIDETTPFLSASAIKRSCSSVTVLLKSDIQFHLTEKVLFETRLRTAELFCKSSQVLIICADEEYSRKVVNSASWKICDFLNQANIIS